MRLQHKAATAMDKYVRKQLGIANSDSDSDDTSDQMMEPEDAEPEDAEPEDAEPEVAEPEVVTEPEVIDLVSNSESDSESEFDESDDDREVGPSMRAFIAALTAANESDRKRRRR